MAALTVQAVPAGGLAQATFANATSGGDTVTGAPTVGGWATRMVALLVVNGDASAKTVTVGGLTGLSVPAGKTAVIPVLQEGIGDNSVAITYSAVTSVTVAAVALAAS